MVMYTPTQCLAPVRTLPVPLSGGLSWEEMSKFPPISRAGDGNTCSQLATQLGPGQSPELLLAKGPPRAGTATPTSHSPGQAPALRLPARGLEMGWEQVKAKAGREGGCHSAFGRSSPRDVASQGPCTAFHQLYREGAGSMGLALRGTPPVQGSGSWSPDVGHPEAEAGSTQPSSFFLLSKVRENRS